jgi:hypothetical protein
MVGGIRQGGALGSWLRQLDANVRGAVTTLRSVSIGVYQSEGGP